MSFVSSYSQKLAPVSFYRGLSLLLHQPVVRRQAGNRSLPCSRDGLLERSVSEVACSENSLSLRFSRFVRHDLAKLVALDEILHPFSVKHVADLQKHPVQLQLGFLVRV